MKENTRTSPRRRKNARSELLCFAILLLIDVISSRRRPPSIWSGGFGQALVLPIRQRHSRHAVDAFPGRRAFGCRKFLALLSTQQASDADPSSLSSSPVSACPFSMTFRRYKIDLTTEKRKKNDDKPSFGFLEKLLPFSSTTSESSESNQKLQSADDPRQTKKWQQQLYTQQDRQNKTPLSVRSNINSVAAMTWLWVQTAAVVNDDTSDQRILVLPDASKLLVQNFVEIIEWMAGNNDSKNCCLIQATMMESDAPALRLTRQESASSSATTIASDVSEETIHTRTRQWVRRILVEQGICPFTKSDRMSGQGLADLGVPVGSIAYHASFQTTAVGLFADTWKAILEMIEAGPNGKEGGVSSILFAAPAFDDDFEYWAGPIFAMLEASVVAAQAEAEIGVVCFHPNYATPDGTTFPGFGHMHSVPRLENWYKEYEENMLMAKQEPTKLSDLDAEAIAAGGAWQRRTPHATINVLRADQLEVAESRRESAKIYTENIEKLVGANGIGNEKLADDLETERQFGSNRKQL